MSYITCESERYSRSHESGIQQGIEEQERGKWGEEEGRIKYQSSSLRKREEEVLCRDGLNKDINEVTIGLVPTVTSEVESKFIALRNKWRRDTIHISSRSQLVLHPAYQAIIGMGKEAIPLLLRELEKPQIDDWFWALHAITQADPVSEKDIGNGEAMAKAWLTWGKNNRYI